MKRLALAVAVALIASGALAQTQPVPTAIAPGGQTMNSTPSAIMIAPAGGAGGKGTVVSPDHPLPVSGTFAAPVGISTAAKQDTGNTSLGSIDGKLSTTNTTLATLATAAGQATASGTLTTIAANTANNATVANQTAPQANAGSDASKALAVQGITGGKLIGVAPQYVASGVTPISGALASVTCTAAFTPIAGRGFNVSGWGTFVAAYEMDRSFDGGTTKLPITAAGTQLYAWTLPASEQAQEPENGVSYYVCVKSYTSGTLNIRISQ